MLNVFLLVLAAGLGLLLWAALRGDRASVDPSPPDWPPTQCAGPGCTQPGHGSRPGCQ